MRLKYIYTTLRVTLDLQKIFKNVATGWPPLDTQRIHQIATSLNQINPRKAMDYLSFTEIQSQNEHINDQGSRCIFPFILYPLQLFEPAHVAIENRPRSQLLS